MAKRYFKTILVGIEAPEAKHQLALRRAAHLAHKVSARLTLFHSVYSPYFEGSRLYRTMLQKGIKNTLADRRAALEKLAAPLRRRGLKVAVKAAWDDPPYDAIVREVLRSKPDLVVAESHRHGLGARAFLTNTDWQLIRLCPAPLLFVKKARPYDKARVLAAIDPLHANAKPARLDGRILETAQALATAHSGRLDVAHVWLPPSMALADPVTGFIDPRLDEELERYLKRTLKRHVAPLDLPPSQLHLHQGYPQSVLPALARRLRTDVLVMGTVSRRGLKRLFIGNTAERVIDTITCDLLVIKPRNFKTPVSRAAAPSQDPMVISTY